MKKKLAKSKKGINYVSFLLLMLIFGCRAGNDETIKNGLATVNVNLVDVKFSTTNLSNKFTASASLESNSNMYRNKIEAKEIERIPLKDDYFLIASYTDELGEPTVASLQASVDPNLTSKIPKGIKYRLIVYNSNGDLVAQKVYTSGTKLSDDGTNLQLDGGRYKFVALSYYNNVAPPPINDPIVSIPENSNLLYYSNEIDVNGNQVNNINIVLEHKYSSITVELDGSELGSISAVDNARITSHYNTNKINVKTGGVTYDGQRNLSIANFTGFNSTKITSSEVIVSAPAPVPDGGPNAFMEIGSVTVNGEIISNLITRFYLKPGNKGKITYRITKIPTVRNVVQVASSYYHTVALTSSGDVYGSGHIDYGELGPGMPKDGGGFLFDSYTNRFRRIRTGTIGAIKKIVAGNGYTFLLSNRGELYGQGNNGNGQLGTGNNTNGDKNSNFVRVNFAGGLIIKDIFAGENQSFILTNTGKILATGQNSSGQLGVGDRSDRNNFIPTIGIPASEIVEQMAVGQGFAVAKTISGKIYGAGTDADGALGGIGGINTEFKEIPFSGGNIANISAGLNSFFVVTTNGRLFVTGGNGEGQLGIGNTTNQRSFVEVTTVNDIKEVHSYENHTIAITNSGVLYTTGKNDRGQLGLGDNVRRTAFIQVTSLVDPIDSALNGVRSAQTIVLSKSGNVYGAGYNYYGVFGLSDFNNRNIFTMLPLKRIVQ
ncbi:hypothetical protein CMT84_05620 [Elizabethkingia anophelis]|nr:hypothetical protein [Elizabethkingia anophelis]